MFEDFTDLYRVAPAANSIPACVGEGRGRGGGGVLSLRKEAMKWGRGRGTVWSWVLIRGD
jgi:hypothetical protein